MKKFIRIAFCASLLLGATVSSLSANAQIAKPVKAVKDTLNNTDETFVNLEVDGGSRSAEAHITKLTGTVAGSASLQGTVDGANWDDIGTALTLSNSATNYKVWDLAAASGNKIYARYRLKIATSGTCSVKVKGFLLKRSD